MEVHVDEDVCIGGGLCADICPDVFKMNDRGFLEIDSDEVPEGEEESCREAAEECPVCAIVIREEVEA
jgi:ferredoxin